jgi:4'-phosphopantetheinyl transferase EntD
MITSTSKLPCRSDPLEGILPQFCYAAELYGEGDSCWLTEDERKCIAKAVPKRMKEFAAGRACARRALLELGLEGASIATRPDRQPVWPAGIVGSISHTNGYCAAAVATEKHLFAVGIDCELIGAVDNTLWKLVGTDRERTWLYSLDSASAALAATLLFAAKEAAFKCQYPSTKEWWDFHDVEIGLPSPCTSPGTLFVWPTRQLKVLTGAPSKLHGSYLIHDRFVITSVWIPQSMGDGRKLHTRCECHQLRGEGEGYSCHHGIEPPKIRETSAR